MLTPVEEGGGENSQETHSYWCGNCDMSIRLQTTAAPPCPHCHTQPLQLMDDDANHATSDIDTTNLFLVDSPSFRRFLVHHHCSFNCDDSDHQQRHYLELLGSLEHSSSSTSSSPLPPPPSINMTIPTIEIEHWLLEMDPTMECAVCKEQFVAGEKAKQLPCSHFFHSHCILPWLSLHNSSTCPLCRFQLLPTVEELP